MPERWTEIKQVDENMHANRRGKRKALDEISFLQNKIKNYDQEYDSLRSHKLFLGKEVYGSPGVRSKLIQHGLTCSNSKVREAAQRLKEEESNVKWDSEVKEELINICVFIDRGTTRISNWNFSNVLFRIGKFGYESIENIEE